MVVWPHTHMHIMGIYVLACHAICMYGHILDKERIACGDVVCNFTCTHYAIRLSQQQQQLQSKADNNSNNGGRAPIQSTREAKSHDAQRIGSEIHTYTSIVSNCEYSYMNARPSSILQCLVWSVVEEQQNSRNTTNLYQLFVLIWSADQAKKSTAMDTLR